VDITNILWTQQNCGLVLAGDRRSIGPTKGTRIMSKSDRDAMANLKLSGELNKKHGGDQAIHTEFKERLHSDASLQEEIDSDIVTAEGGHLPH
jgi:hypothetical protein